MSNETVYCKKCGYPNPSTNTACTNCGTTLSRMPAALSNKPAKLQTLAILCLLDGIANIAWGLFALATAFGGYLLGCIQGPYCITLGIMEVYYAYKLLSNPVIPVKPAKGMAVMQIINIATINLLSLFIGSLAIGVMSLIFYNDTEVSLYFDLLQSGKVR